MNRMNRWKNIPDELKSNPVWHGLVNHNVLIVWKPEYNLGIPILDEQHRGIVSTINSLYYGMQSGHGQDTLLPVINMVSEYTRIHFAVEEKFLKKCNFPEFKTHHKLHEELKRTLSQVGKKSRWNQDPLEFLEFLKKWWIEHICEKDRGFFNYFLNKS